MDRKAEKRRGIMSAAESLFADRRYHEITMDEIAQRAGVGKGTLYRYFPSKDDLFQQSAIAGYEALLSAVEKESASGEFRDYLHRVCGRLSAFFRRRRRLWQMMQVEERRACRARGTMRATWVEHRSRLVAALASVLSRGVVAGVVREDIPVAALAVFLLGMLRTREREGERNSGPVMSQDFVLELFLNGVLARSPARIEGGQGGSVPSGAQRPER